MAILVGALGQTIERAIHREFTRGFREAVNRGENDRQIAKSSLTYILRPNGTVVRLASQLPNFMVPMLGAILAEALKQEVVERALSGDNRPAVRGAKFLLNAAIPGIIIGTTEAIGDAVEHAVDVAVDGQVSDRSTTPGAQRIKPLDVMIRTPLLKGRVFVFERQADGTIRIGRNGLPVVNHPVYIEAVDNWVAAGKLAHTFPFEYVTFDDIAKLAELGGVSSEDLAIAAALKASSATAAPKSPYAGVNDRTWAVIVAFAATASRMGMFDYDQSEDLVKDLFVGPNGAFDPARVNVLERFHGDIVDGAFTDAKFRAIQAFIDHALGGERNRINRIRRFMRQFSLRSATEGFRSAFRWLRMAAFGIFLMAIVLMLIFLGSGVTFFYGLLATIDPLVAVKQIFLGASGMMAVLAISRVADIPFSIIGDFFGSTYDAVTRFSRFLIGCIGIIAGIAMALKIFTIGLSGLPLVMWMFMTAIMLSIGSKAFARHAGWEESANLWEFKTAIFGNKLSLVMGICAFICAILIGLGNSGVSAPSASVTNEGAWKWFANLFATNPAFAAAMLVLAYVLIAWFIIAKTQKLRSFVDRGVRYVTPMPMPYVYAIIVGAILVGLLPFLIHFTHWYSTSDTTSEPSAIVSAPPSTSSVPTTGAPMTSTTSTPVSDPAPLRPRTSVGHQTPCSEIPFVLRKDLARCKDPGVIYVR